MGILATQDLVKFFGKRRIVDGVSLEVKTGEVVGLLGPNGAGKTTTFHMMVGLLRPDDGRITINGQEITWLPIYRRARLGLSYLPQEPSVFRHLSVADNLMAILETLPLVREEREKKRDDVLLEMGLKHLAANKGDHLSGGERRRVEIARAMVMEPEFFLLDEPFAGIDPIAVGELQKIIIKLKEKGIGILITDHNVRETLGICDHAYILNEGRILEAGNAEHISQSSQAREIYLGDKFRL